MTKLETLQKAIEERFWGEGYYIVDKPEDYYVNVKVDDGIFGGKFLRYCTSLKMPFHLDCKTKEIKFVRKDILEEMK